ncbi:hypothetical protein HYDPIDRAFT_106418 [Hydnomerulius pinastri MD-312]|nr:hypothetical protein HYDPIDRAFT_106418 [Hydnomerulius pinastri MD-312]
MLQPSFPPADKSSQCISLHLSFDSTLRVAKRCSLATYTTIWGAPRSNGRWAHNFQAI